MWRMRYFLLILAAVVLVGPVSLLAADKPNVIYVMLDDAGYGDFGAFVDDGVKIVQGGDPTRRIYSCVLSIAQQGVFIPRKKERGQVDPCGQQGAGGD